MSTWTPAPPHGPSLLEVGGPEFELETVGASVFASVKRGSRPGFS